MPCVPFLFISRSQAVSFLGSAWERTAPEALPRIHLQ